MAFQHIRIKNTNVVGKVPTSAQIDVAELCVNLQDEKLYSKKTDGTIFEIGSAGETPSGGTDERPNGPSLGDLYFDTDLDALLYWNGTEWVPVGTEAIALNDLTDVDTSGAQDGMVLAYNGSSWVPFDSATFNPQAGRALSYDNNTDPDTLNADIATKTNLGVVSVGEGLEVSLLGELSTTPIDIPPGTLVQDDAPDPAESGQLWFCTAEEEDGGGRLYVYYDEGAGGTAQWVDVSQPGGGFSGDYNDLINKPNIPEGFDLEDGSADNNLIVWRSVGEALTIELDAGAFDQLNGGSAIITHTDMPTQSNGGGTGLTINYTARRDDGIENVSIASPGSGYSVGDTFQVFDDDGNDRGFGGTVLTTSADVGQHPGPDGPSGWYPEDGAKYYVSTTEDSTVTGSPRFLGNTVFGQRDDAEVLNEGGLISHYSVGNRLVNYHNYYTGGDPGGGRGTVKFRIIPKPFTDLTPNFSITTYKNRATNIADENLSNFGDASAQLDIQENIVARVDTSDNDIGNFCIRDITYDAFSGEPDNSIEFNPRVAKILFKGNDRQMLFHNNPRGVYSFLAGDGTWDKGRINAGLVFADELYGNLNFRQLNRQTGDENDPANYNADGEYTGPTEDLVAVIDNLKQQKADLLATVNDLVARVEALEGA